MKIAFGCDEHAPAGEAVVAALKAAGHQVLVLADPAEWPEAGRRVGQAVASRAADLGVVCCTTGTGVSIAANKVPGVRAALCTDAATAIGARRWNDANVLAFGLRLTTPAVACEMVHAFLTAHPDPDTPQAVARLEP